MSADVNQATILTAGAFLVCRKKALQKKYKSRGLWPKEFPDRSHAWFTVGMPSLGCIGVFIVTSAGRLNGGDNHT